jgi:hypothetical protein
VIAWFLTNGKANLFKMAEITWDHAYWSWVKFWSVFQKSIREIAEKWPPFSRRRILDISTWNWEKELKIKI